MHLIRYLTGVGEFHIVGNKQGYPAGIFGISGTQQSSLECLLLAVCFVKIRSPDFCHSDVEDFIRKRNLGAIIGHYKRTYFSTYGEEPRTVGGMLLEICKSFLLQRLSEM
jgi:hypothetical protein